MRKVMLIVNAYASSVSERAKTVIAKALSADFKLEVGDTAGRDHATELARDAVDRDFDAVLSFGGDGTLNEVLQPLVGTRVALGILPGGKTNVAARSLGMPRDPVDATAYLASHLTSDTRRRVNVGRADGRYFLFSAGMGLDAEVVRRVEANPEAKWKYGHWHFFSHAVRAAMSQYRAADPELTIEVEGQKRQAILAVCCNGRPFTYFGPFPVDVCPHASLDGGLDLFGLKRLHATTVPRVAWALLVSRGHVEWRNGMYHHDLAGATLTSARPLPVQVDGDYIGERDRLELGLERDSLDLLV